MQQIIIGIDPHKLSATIEVVDQHEQRLGSGRFTTDRAGYTAMLTYAKAWARTGLGGRGRQRRRSPVAQRLLEAGEQAVDVPAKLAARVRLFDTGHNRKTDALDAHSIAIVAAGTTTPRVLQVDGELEALRMLTDRPEALTRRRVQTGNSTRRSIGSLSRKPAITTQPASSSPGASRAEEQARVAAHPQTTPVPGRVPSPPNQPRDCPTRRGLTEEQGTGPVRGLPGQGRMSFR